MCLTQDAMMFRLVGGPDPLLMASLISFYAVQLARTVLAQPRPARSAA